QLGLDQPVVGGNGFNSPELYRLAGEAAEGAIVGSPWFPGRDHPKVKDFVARYQERYGRVPDQFAAQAYGALSLFAEAATSAGSALPDAVAETRNGAGVAGLVSCDGHGTRLKGAPILPLRGGTYYELQCALSGPSGSQAVRGTIVSRRGATGPRSGGCRRTG